MKKQKFTKRIILYLTVPWMIIFQYCKLPTEELTPLPPDPGTGMWQVGQLNTNGDARNVKGHIINDTQYAFLSDGQNGLQIISISVPSNPILVSNYNTFGNAAETFIDSVNGGKYAFISDITKGLFILNVSNPSVPVLDTVLTYSGVNSAYTKNGFLYAALVQGNLKVINISNLPDAVFEVYTYIPKNIVGHIELNGNTAFFVERITGLELADISNPGSPVFLSAFRSPGSSLDVKIAGNLAYIADGNAGICIANIGNPAQPYFIAQINTDTDVRGIEYTPNFMLTAEYNSGTEVFNLFNPVSPEAFGYFEPEGFCFGINYFKGKVLVANGQKGLLILKF
ncbi:MAG: hypothetical protein NTV87_06290 [Ignavibacteriae bacterium]|nr:hypothetical protein [Ignavibacteriota bacterium]